jgi:hypothetical protein
LFFGAIGAPLSEMDDWSKRLAVTNFSKNFVTAAARPLSLWMVWTGLALHG